MRSLRVAARNNSLLARCANAVLSIEDESAARRLFELVHCAVAFEAADFRSAEANAFLGLAKRGRAALALELATRFGVDKSTFVEPNYRLFSPIVMAITHGQTDFVRRVVAHFALGAEQVLVGDGDFECDWRFLVKYPAMVTLFADELQWLTKEHLLSVSIETPTLLSALSFTESIDSWRKFKEVTLFLFSFHSCFLF